MAHGGNPNPDQQLAHVTGGVNTEQMDESDDYMYVTKKVNYYVLLFHI